MDTATISYRVADFLKKYPPFQQMDDADVLALAGRGRVRFHERHEHILSQGETHRDHLFVIQQGVVSLWSEVNGTLELRDVRGPGDLLGVERFNGASASLHSARAATDVVTYALPADDFGRLLDTYPSARQYVSAYSAVTLDYQAADERRRPENVFLHDVVKARRLVTCGPQESVREAARSMRSNGVDALAVIDTDHRVCGVVTTADLLAWLADGDGTPDQPVGHLLPESPVALSPVASVADGVLTMGAAGSAALAITGDGTPDGELHALVTASDLAAVFGDQPVWILRDVRRAAGTSELRALNHRARAFALQYLESARSAEWLARFTTLVDEAIVTRVLALARVPEGLGDWAFCGSSGRGESMTRVAPELVLVTPSRQSEAADSYRRVTDLLGECDYLPQPDPAFEPSFHAASLDEWKDRYVAWVRNPILERMYLAHALFDVGRVLAGPVTRLRQGDRGQAVQDEPANMFRELEATVTAAIDRDFLRVIANDCVARLPPLTFFQDAVVDDMGEHSSTFQLDRNVLTPLVDVARVYGIAAGRVLGGSTRDRFAMARRLLPRHEAVFREAADTLSLVLWLQGRVGIRQGTSGAELPPTLISRHDRQALKSGFRVIHRLIDLTANYEWLDVVG